MIGTLKSRNRGGFTFLEIMFVVVIIGILLAIVGPRLAGRAGTAKIVTTRAQLQSISNALKAFEIDESTYPKSLDELVETDDEKKEVYLDGKVVPKDSFGVEFNYKFPGDHNKRSYDLWSNGPDKEEGTDDDITNWDSEKK